VDATSRPRCSEQRIRQHLVHPQTRVAGFCAAAGAASPLHRIASVASRRPCACIGKPRATVDKRTVLLPLLFRGSSLIHSGYTLPGGCLSVDPLPASVPFPTSSRPPRPHRRTRSRTADAIATAEERKNEGDEGRRG